jgi:hypothetical protein
MSGSRGSTDPFSREETQASFDGLWPVAHDLRNCSRLMTKAFEDLTSRLVDERPTSALTEWRWLIAHIDHLSTSLLDGLRAQAVERESFSGHELGVGDAVSPGGTPETRISMTMQLPHASDVVPGSDYIEEAR